MTLHPRDPDWDGAPDPAVIAHQRLTGETAKTAESDNEQATTGGHHS